MSFVLVKQFLSSISYNIKRKKNFLNSFICNNNPINHYSEDAKNYLRKVNVKKLLNESSPLKPLSETEKLWATSAYSNATVFQNDTIKESKPTESSVIMFPGQGSQFVGMARKFQDIPVAFQMFNAASEILGYNLLKLCNSGPEEKLNQTKFCQPAILVSSLAALEMLKERKPWAIENCKGTCGFSLGELASLVFAGCISFEKAIILVKLRAEAMEECCKMAPGGMLTVLYGPGSDLSKAMLDAKDYCETKGISNPVCSTAIFLFPGCKVVAGHDKALNYLIKNKSTYNLRKLSRLPVAGAFHTDLMTEASTVIKESIKNLNPNYPLVKIYSNVTGKPLRNPKDIKDKISLQINHPIKWEQAMHNIFELPQGKSNFPYSYECGPGNSLSTVLKKINAKASEFCSSIQL